MADNKFGFGAVKEKITAMKVELPIKLAKQAENYFTDSWRNQAWDGKAWKEPNRRIPGTNEYRYPKTKDLGRRTRATLVKGSRLRSAVANSIRAQTFNRIRLVVDVPYAAYHNEGTDKIPARSYMKNSPILQARQQEKIKEVVDKVWR